MYYVYVIVDKQAARRYVGYTADLKRRIAEHNSERGAKYTKTGDRLLAYYEAFASREDAVSRERRLKHEGRAKYQLFRRIEKSLADRK
jgi:putative endonuclease